MYLQNSEKTDNLLDQRVSSLMPLQNVRFIMSFLHWIRFSIIRMMINNQPEDPLLSIFPQLPKINVGLTKIPKK